MLVQQLPKIDLCYPKPLGNHDIILRVLVLPKDDNCRKIRLLCRPLWGHLFVLPHNLFFWFWWTRWSRGMGTFRQVPLPLFAHRATPGHPLLHSFVLAARTRSSRLAENPCTCLVLVFLSGMMTHGEGQRLVTASISPTRRIALWTTAINASFDRFLSTKASWVAKGAKQEVKSLKFSQISRFCYALGSCHITCTPFIGCILYNSW